MSTPLTNEQLRAEITDIIKHIDNPYHHYGLGVENEGYGKDSAIEAITQLFHQTLAAREVEARNAGRLEILQYGVGVIPDILENKDVRNQMESYKWRLESESALQQSSKERT